MRVSFGKVATGIAGAAFCLGSVAQIPSASAQVAGAVPFADAHFHGFATGTEVHVGAVTAGTTTLASVDQAFSGSSTSTSGLTTAITSETGNVVQPTEPASPTINSYGRGDGIEVGIGTSTGSGKDPNQIALTGLAESTAPPNKPAVTKTISIPAAPVINANLLTGKAASTWYPDSCPVGQPLSYGNGYAADVTALDLSGNTNPVLATSGTGTATAMSTSYDFLSPNKDGTFGLTSVAEETVAPLTVNLLNLLTLQVTIAGNNPNAPITLAARTTGESSGASVTLGNAGLLKVTLTPAGGTPVTIETVDLNNPQTLGPDGFLHIPLSTSALGTDLGQLSNALSAVLAGNQVTGPLAPLFGPGGPLNGVVTTAGNSASSVVSKLANVSLGSIDIDAVPHAIGGNYTTKPTIVGGTSASGSIDLASVNVQLSGSLLGVTIPSAISAIDIANLKVGHLEASANSSSPVECTIPVIKTASSPSVNPGDNFSYDIKVPNPADLGSIACDLTNMTVKDTISDFSGSPQFTVTSASNGGVVDTISPTSATVTWTGLSYKTGSPPIDLQINLTVPSTSPAGVIQDTVVANATTSNCTGGTSGVTNIGSEIGVPTNTIALTGAFTLQQPSVATVGVIKPATTPAGGQPLAAKPAALPMTGSIGGLWQPFAGLGALVAGGGALALVRRARRLRDGR